MRDFSILLVFCLLTSSFCASTQWNSEEVVVDFPNADIELVGDPAAVIISSKPLALDSKIPNVITMESNNSNEITFHKTSRNLIILFLVLFLAMGTFFIKDYFVQEEKGEAGLAKMRLQQDLESQTVKVLKAKLAERDRELAAFSIALAEKNQMLTRVKGKLNDIYKATDGVIRRKLKPISNSIDQNMDNQQDWLLFQQQLSQLHPGFLDNLKKNFPKLTTNDLRLCAYCRMNFTTSEIANLLHINPGSVQKAKYRLRKKMSLPTGQGLETYFSNLLEK